MGYYKDTERKVFIVHTLLPLYPHNNDYIKLHVYESTALRLYGITCDC